MTYRFLTLNKHDEDILHKILNLWKSTLRRFWFHQAIVKQPHTYSLPQSRDDAWPSDAQDPQKRRPSREYTVLWGRNGRCRRPFDGGADILTLCGGETVSASVQNGAAGFLPAADAGGCGLDKRDSAKTDVCRSVKQGWALCYPAWRPCGMDPPDGARTP